MQIFVAFLRALNMAGHNSVKMKDLSELFAGQGFSDITTYIQSGNVIFRYAGKEKVKDITQKIEKAITTKFGLDIDVMVRSVDELKGLEPRNPFLLEESFTPVKMAVIFLNEKASEDSILAMKKISYPPDKFEISGREIFIYCLNGFGRTKLYTNFFEKKMGVRGTARNWKSITTILGIAEKL